MKYKDIKKDDVHKGVFFQNEYGDILYCHRCDSPVPLLKYERPGETVSLCYLCANSATRAKLYNQTANNVLLLLNMFDEYEVVTVDNEH